MLEDIKLSIQQNPNNKNVNRLIAGATKASNPSPCPSALTLSQIAQLTSDLILLTEGAQIRKIVEEAKTLARWARAVIVGVASPYEV